MKEKKIKLRNSKNNESTAQEKYKKKNNNNRIIVFLRQAISSNRFNISSKLSRHRSKNHKTAKIPVKRRKRRKCQVGLQVCVYQKCHVFVSESAVCCVWKRAKSKRLLVNRQSKLRICLLARLFSEWPKH